MEQKSFELSEVISHQEYELSEGRLCTHQARQVVQSRDNTLRTVAPAAPNVPCMPSCRPYDVHYLRPAVFPALWHLAAAAAPG